MGDEGGCDKGILQIGGCGEWAEVASWRETQYTRLGMGTVDSW